MAEGSSSALAVVGVEAVEGGGGGAELQALQGGLREYRKGNWTLHETVVLIAAKKKDEERRLKGGEKEKSRTAELRWKWIENYCWHNGCHRNQNQCNDKWDNLLRDYKKVRDYEMRLAALPSSAASASASSSTALQAPPPPLSYWQLEKHERKEKGLPSNLLFQVYEALHEVVDKRYPLRGPAASAVPAAAAGNNHQITPPPPPLLLQPPPQLVQQQEVFHSAAQPQPQPQPQPAQLLAQQQQQHAGTSTSVLSGKPFAASIPTLPQQTPAHSSAPTHPSPAHAAEYASDSSQSEESEVPASPAKRRKVGGKAAVERSTTELTQALLACEERKDRRHRDLLSVEEKKLMLENTKTQISRDGIAGLIAAINNLAAAVVSLASDKSLGGAGD